MKRLIQLIVGILSGVLSAIILAFTHRLSLQINSLEVPVGIIFALSYTFAISLVLALYFEKKLALIVNAATFAALIFHFSGNSAGGGILMPASLNEVYQWQGPAVQFIGVLVPMTLAAVIWIQQIKQLANQANIVNRNR